MPCCGGRTRVCYDPPKVELTENRQVLAMRGRRLEYFTIAWNAFEGLAAVVSINAEIDLRRKKRTVKRDFRSEVAACSGLRIFECLRWLEFR